MFSTIKDKIYATARKVSENFKKNMKIVFDDYLGKWNYRVIPEMKTWSYISNVPKTKSSKNSQKVKTRLKGLNLIEFERLLDLAHLHQLFINVITYFSL